MIETTIQRIREKLEKSPNLAPEKREELLALLGELQREVEQLDKDRDEEAQSILGFAEMAAHQATRERREPKLVEASNRGLIDSIESFESSHPELSRVVQTISHILSRMGI